MFLREDGAGLRGLLLALVGFTTLMDDPEYCTLLRDRRRDASETACCVAQVSRKASCGSMGRKPGEMPPLREYIMGGVDGGIWCREVCVVVGVRKGNKTWERGDGWFKRKRREELRNVRDPWSNQMSG